MRIRKPKFRVCILFHFSVNQNIRKASQRYAPCLLRRYVHRWKAHALQGQKHEGHDTLESYSSFSALNEECLFAYFKNLSFAVPDLKEQRP
jgi:hypothetical protein